MNKENILTVSGLSKFFKNIKALDSVTFAISKGDICGLIGKNGAGKSTLLKIICNFSNPSAGEYKYAQDVKFESFIDGDGFYLNMSAYDNLKMKALAHGISEGRIKEIMQLVGVNADKRKVKAFSTGMKQRLGIALSFLSEPDILILDEPLNGVDVEGVVELRNLILHLNEEKAVTFVISSHDLLELENVCNRFIFMNGGKMILNVTKEELYEKYEDKVDDKNFLERLFLEYSSSQYDM